MENIEGIPIIGRDPVVFARVLLILEDLADRYRKIDPQEADELDFLCVDYNEVNKRHLQRFFQSNPFP